MRRNFGEVKQRAMLALIVADFVLSFNLGNTMDDRQIAQTVNEIIDDYSFLKLDDLRLCFKNAQKGHYEKIFRMDKSVILSCIEKYSKERIEAAIETSENESLQYKESGRYISIKQVENVSKKFMQWKQ